RRPRARALQRGGVRAAAARDPGSPGRSPRAPMTKDLEEVPCNLCGSPRSRVRFEALAGWLDGGGGHFAATTDKFGAYGTIRQCLDCGLLYTSPRLKASALSQEYERTKDEDYFSERDSRSMNAYLSLAALRRHAPGGRLLDVGCSTGFF